MYSITIHEEDYDDVNEYSRHFDTLEQAYTFSEKHYTFWKTHDWAGYETQGIPVFPTFNQFARYYVPGSKNCVYEFGNGCVMEIWLY